MALCGIPHCDIVGELHGRNIYDITDKVLLLLDWPSLKDASLVSKAWRKAVKFTLKTIVMKGNPYWSEKEVYLWRKIGSHLKLDFQVPAKDPLYIQRFANSIQLVFEQFQEKWIKPESTLDYVPFNHRGGHTCEEHELSCHFEMNEKFIVGWDPKTQLLNFWSRHTLSPLKMDLNFRFRQYPVAIGGIGMTFQLDGNHLVYGEMFRGDDCDIIEITKVDLEAKSRGVREPAENVICSCLVPSTVSGKRSNTLIRNLWFAGDFILLMFLLSKDRSEYHVTVLWKAQEAKADIDLRPSVLKVPSLDLANDIQCFFDVNYFVAKWSIDGVRTGFRTYSLHPTRAGSPVELHLMTAFDMLDVGSMDYKNGIIVSASELETGKITLMDVAKGELIIVVKTAPGSIGRTVRLTRNYLMCSEISSKFRNYSKRTFYYIWDLETLIQESSQGVRELKMKAYSTYKTLAAWPVDVKADELGIVAAIHSEPGKGLQVLSFVPGCSYCKRVMKPALLKKCSRCKSATYCSKKCQSADWNPHHKAICDDDDTEAASYYDFQSEFRAALSPLTANNFPIGLA